jgi:predicted Rossmann fold flavoprotein
MKSPVYDICIIGGGAAGTMAAISAARELPSSKIIILEKNEILGRKILATGNGRCNLTNINASADDYYGSSRVFIKNVLNHLSPKDTIEYFNKIGVITKEEDRGRIFPRTNHASTVVNALEEELHKNNIEISLNQNVKNIDFNSNWEITTESGKIFLAKKIILTTGGRAAHQFGSNGDGLFWLNKKFRVELEEPHAALVPINLDFEHLKDIMGIKLVAELKLKKDEIEISASRGEIIFTHFGISGPAAMSLGRNITSANKYTLLIDLLPEFTITELDNQIQALSQQNGNKNIKNIIAGFLPEKIAKIVCEISEINPLLKVAEISKNNRKIIINNLKALTFKVDGLRPLKEAQVTAGGIKESEINPNTLEIKKLKSAYVAGEIIDVDGRSGGYNLQWAWSSGYLAGVSVAREINNETIY